jgi:hypothetical protein
VKSKLPSHFNLSSRVIPKYDFYLGMIYAILCIPERLKVNLFFRYQLEIDAIPFNLEALILHVSNKCPIKDVYVMFKEIMMCPKNCVG